MTATTDNINFNPIFVNVHLGALRKLNIKIDQYAYCYLSEQLQGQTGWVEPGALNGFRFPYPLKIWIGAQLNFMEHKTNRIFKKLRKLGFIEVSECKQRFRVTEQFRAFDNAKPDTLNHKEFQSRFAFPENGSLSPIKKTFAQSAYYQNKQVFRQDLEGIIKIKDVDYDYYFDTIQHYYTVEHPEKAYVDWLHRSKKWIQDDQHRGKLVRVKATTPPPSVSPIARLSDSELCDELDMYFGKMMTPETEIFSEYKETAETFADFANEALKRGDRVLGNDKAKEAAKKLLIIIKKDLRNFFDSRLAQQRAEQTAAPMAVIKDLAISKDSS